MTQPEIPQLKVDLLIAHQRIDEQNNVIMAQFAQLELQKKLQKSIKWIMGSIVVLLIIAIGIILFQFNVIRTTSMQYHDLEYASTEMQMLLQSCTQSCFQGN